MDWIGNSLNIPLYRLWGLDHTKLPLTSFSIGIDTPEVGKQKTREAAPYKILKVKVGKKNNKELIGAVRSAARNNLYLLMLMKVGKIKRQQLKKFNGY